MTFNWWTGKEAKKERFVDIIRLADPDIAIINEANDPEVFYEIADTLKYERVLSVHNKYYVGILSKYKIEDHQCYLLKNLAKSLVEIKVSVPELDKPLYVFACHLVALNTSGRAKKRGIEMDTILPYVKKRLNSHVIFAGDMNEESHLDRIMPEKCISRSISDLGLIDSYRNYYKSPLVAPGFTHNILMIPTKRIDYIYGSSTMEVKNSEVLDKKYYRNWPSDHAAVITEFKQKEEILNTKPVVISSKIEDKKSERIPLNK